MTKYENHLLLSLIAFTLLAALVMWPNYQSSMEHIGAFLSTLVTCAWLTAIRFKKIVEMDDVQ